MIEKNDLMKMLMAEIFKGLGSDAATSISSEEREKILRGEFNQSDLMKMLFDNGAINDILMAELMKNFAAEADSDEKIVVSKDEPLEKPPIAKSFDKAIGEKYSAPDRAAILVEALPYIQEFSGKTVVIKYGGNAMVHDELKDKVMQDVALMKYVGIRVVIVHGGGPEITEFLKKVGKESSFVSGLRVTDEETVEIAEMVLDGKINSEIVTLLNRRGLRAVGLSGKDAGLIRAEKKLATVYEQGEKTKVDIGYVGKAKHVDITIVNDLLERGYVPVIAPIGVGEHGESYNINADYVAADIAGALKAEKLLLLTDTEGVYGNFEDKSSFISTLTSAEAREMIRRGLIAGGMIPKVEACLRSIAGGTKKTHIIDGRLPHSIILELFTDQGIGTQVE